MNDYEMIIPSETEEITRYEETQTVIEKLSPVINALNTKYGTEYRIETLESAINTSITLKKKEKQLQKLINSEIATNLVDLVAFRCLCTLSFVIDSQLKAVMSDAQLINNFNVNSVALVEKLFLWIKELEEAKKKFNVSDVEKQIKDLQINTKEEDDEDKRTLVNNLLTQLKEVKNGTNT